MGKTKVAVVGEAIPEEDKKKKERAQAKKATKKAASEVAAKKSESQAAKKTDSQEDTTKGGTKKDTQASASNEKKISKYAAKKGLDKKEKSKRFKESEKEVDKTTKYPLDKALTILNKFKKANFDETVELHLNTREDKMSGTLTLPHGTGKKMTIKVADDALLKEIEKGNIDFDILLAKPEMMPKLAKVARILGPRGLMPNPKNGTVTQEPEKTIKELEGGSINYRTESKAPIIHLSVGKKSYDEKKLSENVKAAIKTIGTTKIKSAILTSSQNPGIRLDVTKC